MRLYHVMTYLGTDHKTFQHRGNAERYAQQLRWKYDLDADLVEMYSYEATQEEYINTDLED